MADTALGEKDNVCGLCYLYSKKLGVCLLSGDEVMYDHTCLKWLAWDTCKSCLIDFKEKEASNG